MERSSTFFLGACVNDSNPAIGGIWITEDAYRGAFSTVGTPSFRHVYDLGGAQDVGNCELAVGYGPPYSGLSPANMYAATGQTKGSVLRSTDGGSHWTQITNGFCGGQCFYDVAIAVAPNNASRLYIGGDATIPFGFSTNSGGVFTNIFTNLHADTQAIAVALSQPSTIYLGSDGGIFKSTDSGATWASLNNFTFSATQFNSIAVHPTDPNFTIGGTQDNGTDFYQANGTWTQAAQGDGGDVVIDRNSPDTTNVRMYHTFFNQTSGTPQIG